MGAIVINGTTFYASDIQHERNRVGTELESANGTLHVFVRGARHEWEIPFNGVSNATRNALETIAALTTTFSFVDERGLSFTVLCPLNPYSDRVSFIKDNSTQLYDVTLKLRQA